MTNTTAALVISAQLKGEIAKARSLKDVAFALDTIVPEVAPVTSSALYPKPVVITPEAQAAMDALPSVFGVVHPDSPKILSDDEMCALYQEREIVREALAPLSGRDEVIKEIVRHHMDLVAIESNVAVDRQIIRGGHVVADATPRDTKGHFILASKDRPEQCPIPHTNKAWSREFRSGSISFNFAAGDLLALYEAGDITREQYLNMTRETRVFDEGKTMECLRKDPETYLPIFTAVAQRSADSTSIAVRNAK